MEALKTRNARPYSGGLFPFYDDVAYFNLQVSCDPCVSFEVC